MTFDFAIPERFNDDLAEQGVWFEIYAEKNQHFGDFKCIHANPESTKLKLAQERAQQRNQKGLRTGAFKNDDLVLEIFLDVVLVDWRGVKDSKGKDVPYSKAAAKAYFSTKGTKYALQNLMVYAADPTNFDKADPEEVVGN